MLIKCVQVSLVYLYVYLKNSKKIIFISLSLLLFFFKDFVSVSSPNPHKTTLIHYEKSRGLMGLLHVVSVTVISMKAS